MGLSFHECMQGHLTDRWGRQHPIDFQLKAEASHLTRVLLSGQAKVTGIVHATPWADSAPLDGDLTMKLLFGRRFIRYELGFADAEGRRYALFAQKDLSFRRPLASISYMPATLSCEGEELARGEMRFDMNDVMGFMGSAFPAATSFKQLDLHAVVEDGHLEARPLGERDEALFAALADAMIEPGVHVPAADESTLAHAREILARMPAGYVTAFSLALRALDVTARARYGRSFDALPRDKRVALVMTLEDLGGPTGGMGPHHVLHLAGMPIRAAHFNREEYLRGIGAPTYENPVREQDPPWVSRITPAEDLPSEIEIECEVAVVGTGAGGAAIAATLAEKGLAVAILEEGRYMARKEFAGSPLDRMRKLWRDSGMTFSIGNPPVSLPMGRMVGGTTAINSGTCFRAPEAVFADWRRDAGLPDGFSAEGFDRYYRQVEEELQVTRAEKKHLGRIADIVAKGAAELGLDHHALPRNAPGCDGQGVCVVGCPSDAKRSTNVSYVPRALMAGAEVYTGLPVTRLLIRNRRVVAIEARGTDSYGAPKVLRVKAKAFVLSCGTLLTPFLLRDNGFDLPWLGKNLSVHPEVGMWVRLDEPIAPWHAIPQSYGVDGIPDIKFEGYWVPPQIAGATIPLLGKELTRWMDAYDHVGQFGFMVKDEGSGSVSRGLDGRPLIRYDVNPRTHRLLQQGATILAEMLIRGGGREVLSGIRRRPSVKTIEEARAIGTATIPVLDWNLLGSHPLGTCRVAASADKGVCDPDHRVFGTENLYVVDGGSVPTSLGVNPQLTIMAMATRAGEILADRLSG